jgi:hypothetical protein
VRPQFRLGFVEPCIPTVSRKIPEGPLWVHELKHEVTGSSSSGRKTAFGSTLGAATNGRTGIRVSSIPSESSG